MTVAVRAPAFGATCYTATVLCRQNKKQIIELLDVRATLKIEDSEKIVYAQCSFDEKRLTIESHITVNVNWQKRTLR